MMGKVVRFKDEMKGVGLMGEGRREILEEIGRNERLIKLRQSRTIQCGGQNNIEEKSKNINLIYQQRKDNQNNPTLFITPNIYYSITELDFDKSFLSSVRCHGGSQKFLSFNPICPFATDKILLQHFTIYNFLNYSNLIMLPSTSLYALLITSALGVVFGITTLILALVFKYIGFAASNIAQGACIDFYLILKYRFLPYQLVTSLVGVCIGLLMFIIVLVFVILAVKNLRSQQANNNQQKTQILFQIILSKTKYAVLYVLLSVGTLGNIVCFGSYLALIVQVEKFPLACEFFYIRGDLIALVVISGIWLLIFLVAHVLALKFRAYFEEDELILQRMNRYKQTLNVTEQPAIGKENQKQNILNDLEDSYEQDSHSFGNRNFKPFKGMETEQNLKSNPNNEIINQKPIVNSQNSFGGDNKKKKDGKQAFHQYRDRQMKELLNKKVRGTSPKEQRIPKYLNQDSYDDRRGVDFNEVSPKNQQFLNFYQPSNYEKPKTYSPIKKLSEDPIRRYGSPETTSQLPQRIFKNAPSPQKETYRPESSYRGEQNDTRGHLVFYKKPAEKNSRYSPEKSDRQQNNSLPKNKNSEAELSFKSPSRFDSKFAEQERDYLGRNMKNSILPSNNIREVQNGSRKINFDDKNSSSGFGQEQSPNLSQGKSRAKAREGVLTNFIRGKFN